MIVQFARLIRRLSNWAVPASAPRSLCRGFWVFASLSAVLSAPVVVNIWAASLWNVRAIGACRAAAVVTAVTAALCWADARRYDRDMRMVTRALGDALDRLPGDDLREMMVRQVGSVR